MAAELIDNPKIPHAPEHDIESVFWVLLFLTLMYTKTRWDPKRVSSTLTEAMNPKVYPTGGGATKLSFIRDPASVRGLFSDQSPGLYALLKDIHQMFSLRYLNKSKLQTKELDDLYSELRRTRKKVKGTDEMPSKSADESMDESTNKSADESIANMSTNEAGIATQSGDAVPLDSETLYGAVLHVFEEVLGEDLWSETDCAERQCILIPSEAKSAAQSGSKRSRDMLEQTYGTTLSSSNRLDS
jgi:hypothetical protein